MIDTQIDLTHAADPLPEAVHIEDRIKRLLSVRRRVQCVEAAAPVDLDELVTLAQFVEQQWRPNPQRIDEYGSASGICWWRLLIGLGRVFLQCHVKRRSTPSPRATGRYFLVLRKGGLCNRLRIICAFLAASKITGRSLSWSWTPGPHCPGGPAFHAGEITHGQVELSSIIAQYREEPDSALVLSNPIEAELVYRTFLSPLGIEEADFFVAYHEFQHRLLAAFVDAYALSERLDEVRSRLNTGYIGVHVRRTDKVHRWTRLRPDLRFPVTDDYAKILDEMLAPAERFFLCCDDLAAKREFDRLYGNRVVTFPGLYSDALRQTSIAHSVADLVLLTGASTVIGTPESSFSSFAIRAGNARAVWPCALTEKLV